MSDNDGAIIEYNGERYYTADAAAAYLKRKRAWLYNVANERGLKRYTFDYYGKRRYFRESDLDAIRKGPPHEADGPKTETVAAA